MMAQLPGGSRRRHGGVWNFRAWLTAHPVAADAAIAVCLMGLTFAHLAVNHQTSITALALAVAVLLPLPLRRWAPEAVFVVVLAVALLALALSQAQVLAAPVVSALLLALYTVAAHRPRQAALICGAGFEVWAVLALLGWIPHGDYVPALFLMTGTATAAVMTGVNLQTRVLVLTTFDLDEYAFAALRAGASGFVLKSVEPDELLAAIRTVMRGDAVVAPRITRRLLETFAHQLPAAGEDLAASKQDPRLALLTPREREILIEVAQGRSNAEIAERLFLTESTIKTHIRRILPKLGLRDRVQAVVFAYETKLIQPS